LRRVVTWSTQVLGTLVIGLASVFELFEIFNV
jgi:hypothetical protein